MADHLRSQEYERVRHSKSMLAEPRLCDEDAARLVEAYERNNTSASEYLVLVTENCPFTPTSTTHAVIIDSGTYCTTVAMAVIFNSFLQDHGNAVVQELLSRYEVVLVEKASAGQEVNLLGRKFKIKRQSPFNNKFYLDVFGVRSTETANELFMGLTRLGARPFFLTPRDVNMETHVTTPTWRFYFGQEEVPACLKVGGYVTNQLVCGQLETDGFDAEMQSTPSDEDVDMGRRMETGFKRTDRSQPSFADENPYASLEIMDCEFETFEPDFTLGTITGILVFPHLSPSGATQEDSEPLPTKRRSSTSGNPSSNMIVAEEEILVAAEEAELESHEDRVAQNMQHLKASETLLKTSKNMDKIAATITAMPLAWYTALCADLAEGGEYVEELASIHLLTASSQNGRGRM
ncbi:hypothetical protein ON010_g16169 [Phytophthora cinnamomi]|nr:hypothetical protein ON010_g16169 [Phytophthora cinnamomi]